MWIHLWALLGEVHSIKPTFAMTGMQTHSRGPPASGPLSSVLWKEYKILKGGYVKWLKSPLFSITIGRRHHVHSFSVCLLVILSHRNPEPPPGATFHQKVYCPCLKAEVQLPPLSWVPYCLGGAQRGRLSSLFFNQC